MTCICYVLTYLHCYVILFLSREGAIDRLITLYKDFLPSSKVVLLVL